LTQRRSLEFRASAINLLNRVNWLVGDQALLGPSGPGATAQFDNNVTPWNSPRALQIAVRALF